MATKSQLKTYFEKGDIPTSTQFGELIDSLLSVPSEDTMDRPNQNLFFGNGEENPYIQGVRTVSKIVGTNVITMFIFSTHNNNDNTSSFPLFILNRTSTRAASLNNAQATLRYCIPNKLNIDNFVMHGLDCDNSTDDEIITEVSDWEFKPFEKDNFNHNILNICTNISGTFSTFVFNLADINVGGSSKTLPIELMVIINDNKRFIVDGPYYIKNTTNENSFLVDWDALILLLNKSYGTITTTNSMVVTKCNNIKNNYMEKR
jgi:hypothetical protein